MIRYGSEVIPDLQIPVPDQFVIPERREHIYVPGSAVADISLFGKSWSQKNTGLHYALVELLSLFCIYHY